MSQEQGLISENEETRDAALKILRNYQNMTSDDPCGLAYQMAIRDMLAILQWEIIGINDNHEKTTHNEDDAASSSPSTSMQTAL